MSTEQGGPLGVAVLGLGRLGWRHAENLAGRVAGARLVAAADKDLARLREAKSLWPETAATKDPLEAISHPKVQAVVIATTTETHADLVVATAAQGLPIFCEKPLGTDLASARRAADAAVRADVLLQVGFMRRFDESYARAHRLVAEGRIGRPLAFRSVSLDGVVSSSPAFLATCGGIMVDVGLHDFDLAEWLMGRPVVEVQARGDVVLHDVLRAYGDVDVASVTLRFAGGGLGSVYVAHCAPLGYEVWSEVIGDKSVIRAGSILRDELTTIGGGSYARGVYRDFLDRFAPAYLSEMEAFVRAVRSMPGGRVPMDADGTAAVRALTVALAARRSLQSGRAETLDDEAQS